MDPVVVVFIPFAIAAGIVIASMSWFIWRLRWHRDRTNDAPVDQTTEYERIAARAALDQTSVTTVDLDDWDDWLAMEATR